MLLFGSVHVYVSLVARCLICVCVCVSAPRPTLVSVTRSTLMSSGGGGQGGAVNPWLVDESEETRGLSFGDIKTQQQQIIEGWFRSNHTGLIIDHLYDIYQIYLFTAKLQDI